MNTPNPVITTITNANEADVYQYIIIAKSMRGRHINAGFTHDEWNEAIFNHLRMCNKWLGGLKLDSLQSVVLISNDQLNSPNITKSLNTGLESDAINRYANFEATCSEAWSLESRSDDYMEVTHIDELSTIPFNSKMMGNYKGALGGEYLISIVTELNKDFIFTCNAFTPLLLISLQIQINENHCKRHNDKIKTITLSKRGDSDHMAIIERLLQTRCRIDNVALQRMIGKPPQPPSTPPTIVPTAPKSPKPPPMNNAIHAQAGNTYLSILAIISFTILLCLPFQCAMAYTEDLSKKYSDLPSRKPLAFFVPDVCPASQVGHTNSVIQIYPSRGNTVYDGLTLQNKIALGRICRAVTILTESKTRHPIPIVCNTVDSVALTQNNIGVSYHG